VPVAQRHNSSAGRRRWPDEQIFTAQLAVNTAFGIWQAFALFHRRARSGVLGNDGRVAALYPYLGIWIAAAMPALLAFAVEPGWVKVPLVFGTYFGIDLLMYNFVEPLLYGTSTGVSRWPFCWHRLLDLALGPLACSWPPPHGLLVVIAVRAQPRIPQRPLERRAGAHPKPAFINECSRWTSRKPPKLLSNSSRANPSKTWQIRHYSGVEPRRRGEASWKA